jgi:hypothetical protein
MATGMVHELLRRRSCEGDLRFARRRRSRFTYILRVNAVSVAEFAAVATLDLLRFPGFAVVASWL